jgi:hypothetical protein
LKKLFVIALVFISTSSFAFIKGNYEIEAEVTTMSLASVTPSSPILDGPYVRQLKEGWQENGKSYNCEGYNEGHGDSLVIYQIQNLNNEIGYYSVQKLDTSKDFQYYPKTSGRVGFYYSDEGTINISSGRLSLTKSTEVITLARSFGSYDVRYSQNVYSIGASNLLYRNIADYSCKRIGFPITDGF